MGTLYAPKYANIFMGKFERNFIYPFLQTFSKFYCWFVVDIFLLWNRSKTPSLNFITKLNSRYPTIKFDFKYSKSCINFLDKNLQSKEKNKSLTIYIYIYIYIYISEFNRSEEYFWILPQPTGNHWLIAYHFTEHSS